MTWLLSWSYSCRHCFFRSAGLGFLVPFGTGCLPREATQRVKFGGSGGAALAPWPAPAVRSHLLNSAFVTVESPTFATAFDGTSRPHPDAAMAASPAMAAAQAS